MKWRTLFNLFGWVFLALSIAAVIIGNHAAAGDIGGWAMPLLVGAVILKALRYDE